MNNIFHKKTKAESTIYDTVCIDTTKTISIKIYGNIKRKKQPHNFPEMVKFEIQI